MSTQELKSMLKWIREQGVVSEGDAYKKWAADESSDARSKVLSSLYTLEGKGLISYTRVGEVRCFSAVRPEQLQ